MKLREINLKVTYMIQQIRIYYKSGTGGRCCICARQTLRVHSPGGSTFLREMSWQPSWECDGLSGNGI